tara:strand:+ start:12358 stop:13746 length:1389 start_codon:yes stop_codon:yes gene_type:complete
LPYSTGHEKSILSSIFQEPARFLPEAEDRGITSDHFYLPPHRILFDLFQEISEGGEVELVSLIALLRDRSQLALCGGPAYLAEIYTYAPTPAYFTSHVGKLVEKRKLRGLIEMGQVMIESSYEQTEEPARIIEEAERALSLLNVTEGANDTSRASASVDEIIQEMQDLMKGVRNEADGLATGYEGMDALGVRLCPGEVFVIAARPSMGKTSLMMNIVENICIDAGVPSLVFSMEMTKKQIIKRLIYSRAKFAVSMLSRGYTPKKPDLERIRTASIHVGNAELYINDTAGLTVSAMRSKARRLHKEKKIALIAIDYLQLMRSTSKQAQSSREREVAEISAGVKALAKELNVPIVLLAQLNRESEKRTGSDKGIPRLADLRESGSVEQDADLVGLLHRPERFATTDDEREAKAGQAFVELAKNRNGATGQVAMTFIADLMQFKDGKPAPPTKDEPTEPENRYQK